MDKEEASKQLDELFWDLLMRYNYLKSNSIDRDCEVYTTNGLVRRHAELADEIKFFHRQYKKLLEELK